VRTLESVILAAVVSVVAIGAQAAPITCSNSSLGARAVTIDDGAACAGVGINSLTDAQLVGLSFVDTVIDRDPPGGPLGNNEGALGLSVSFNPLGLAWSINGASSLWNSNQNLYLYVGLQPTIGFLNPNPDYFIFQLNQDDTSGFLSPAGSSIGGFLGSFALRDVALVGQVPEPGTLALAGLALAGVAASVRRRRQQRG
jgi:hypothetical protein